MGYINDSADTIQPNTEDIGCVESESCSATWVDGVTMICSARYMELSFAQLQCRQIPSCDFVYEISSPAGTHFELASTRNRACAFVNTKFSKKIILTEVETSFFMLKGAGAKQESQN